MSKMDQILRDLVAPIFRRPRRLQVAALCHRQTKRGKEVLLVTSRGTGRWILPKGWPMRGKTDAEAAAQEAWEEAGVKPRSVGDTPIGSYGYDKVSDAGLPVPTEAHIYPIEVEALEDDFPEAEERSRKWVSVDTAAELVDEPELRSFLKDA